MHELCLKFIFLEIYGNRKIAQFAFIEFIKEILLSLQVFNRC